MLTQDQVAQLLPTLTPAERTFYLLFLLELSLKEIGIRLREGVNGDVRPLDARRVHELKKTTMRMLDKPTDGALMRYGLELGLIDRDGKPAWEVSPASQPLG